MQDVRFSSRERKHGKFLFDDQRPGSGNFPNAEAGRSSWCTGILRWYALSLNQLCSYQVPLGQHNDSRMNIALIMTAVKLGSVVANHCEVTELLKGDSGKLIGARVKDKLTGEEFNVRAKVSPTPIHKSPLSKWLIMVFVGYY